MYIIDTKLVCFNSDQPNNITDIQIIMYILPCAL